MTKVKITIEMEDVGSTSIKKSKNVFEDQIGVAMPLDLNLEKKNKDQFIDFVNNAYQLFRDAGLPIMCISDDFEEEGKGE